jgi:hypothetical protein
MNPIPPSVKKTASIAAICALFFIGGALIPSRQNPPPQSTAYSEVAKLQDSIELVQKQAQRLQEKIKQSEAKAETLRKNLTLQKEQYVREVERLRSLPSDSLYELFTSATGGIDTAPTTTYRIPSENIMQADIIFAERDYLLRDTTTKSGIINALGEQVGLLWSALSAQMTETRLTAEQRDLYKTEAQEQTAIAQKERNKATWIKVGWVASEIATIILFIAL